MNARTDLCLSYEPVKTGRKLTHLKFTIKPQAWQLQLFEAEHAARLVTELAKTFDGPVLESKATPAEITPMEDRARAALIDQCVKLGVSSKTVERALEKHGLEGVGEIIAHTKARWKKMKAKGEGYEAKDYLARMLNDGIGVKSPAERRKTAQAREGAAKRKAAREAKAEAEAEKQALEERYRKHRHARTQALLAGRSAAETAELLAGIDECLSNRFSRRHRKRWEEIGRAPTRVGELDRAAFGLIGTTLADMVLSRWGDPADTELEAFKAQELAAA